MPTSMNLRETITVVFKDDPAVVGGYEEYSAGGFDETLLKLEGEPVRWTLQRMTYDQRLHHDDLKSAVYANDFAVRACLKNVKGFKVKHIGGEETDLPPIEHEKDVQFGVPMVKASWLRDTNLPPSIFAALGAVGRVMSEGTLPFPSS